MELEKHVMFCKKNSSEGRQQGRANKYMFDSLEKIKLDLEEGAAEVTKIKGFIQKIGFSPVFVYYFSENGIRLWHGLAQRQPGFLDATGSVVKKNKTSGKKFLYYELCVQNPSAGNTSIPIAAMITEQQNAPQITDFINCFQHAEKLIYGHSSVCQPIQINIDFSMALLTSVLKAVNVETLEDYLNRCWRILNGSASSVDFKKTTVHICLAHIMNNMKRKIKDVQKKNLEYMLFFIGLLINCKTLTQMKEIILDGFVVFSCAKFTRAVQKHQDRLTRKINSFDTSCNLGINYIVNSDITDDDEVTLTNSNFYEEEMFLKIGNTSPFKTFCDKIYHFAESIWTSDEDTNNSPLNSKYCPRVILLLRKWYFPTLPLWCNLMLDDLCRHLSDQQQNSPAVFDLYKAHDQRDVHNASKTTSVVEQRFNVLKNTHLQGRKLARLDDFSSEIHMYFKSNQKNAVLMHMKNRKRKTISVKKHKTVTGQWAKNETKPSQLSDSGKYQRRPQRTFQTPSSDVHDNSDYDVLATKENITKFSGKENPNFLKRLSLRTETNKPSSTYVRRRLKLTKMDSKCNANTDVITMMPRKHPSHVFRKFMTEKKLDNNMDVARHKTNRNGEHDQLISSDQKSTYSNQVQIPFVEMMNIGNTCWLNSALQAFAKTKVIGEIASEKHLNGCEANLLNMLKLLRIGCSERDYPYIQGLFHDEKGFPTLLEENFALGMQHDVHEFYTKMLSHILVKTQGKLKVC